MSDTHAEAGTRWTTVDIVLPVYNEEHDLDTSVRRLRSYLDRSFPFEATITVVDNASTDATWEAACHLETELKNVCALHLDEKGRGRALRTAWSKSGADIVAYMDVDLSTDLDALLPLVAPLVSGHSEVSIGSRLALGAHVIRGAKRELISRSYNLLLHMVLHNKFTDAQCGFKAIRAVDARALLPAIEDNEWFFDTELLVLAERNGMRIHEVPVDWTDDADSRVRIARTAMADLHGVLRMMRSFAFGGGYIDTVRSHVLVDDLPAFARLARVSLLHPVAYLVVYVGLFLVLRTQMNSYVANIASLVICSAWNCIAHWFTRSRTPHATYFPAFVAGETIAFCALVVVTTWCLAAANGLDRKSTAMQIGGLLVGIAVSTLVRFVSIRASQFHGHLLRHQLDE